MTEGRQVLREDPAEVLLGTSCGRTVIVGKVEVEHPKIEGFTGNVPLGLERAIITEVVPQSQGNGGELKTGVSCSDGTGSRRIDWARAGMEYGSWHHNSTDPLPQHHTTDSYQIGVRFRPGQSLSIHLTDLRKLVNQPSR